MSRDRSLEQRQVEPVEALNNVSEGVDRLQIQIRVDGAEDEVEVDQDRFVFLARAERGSQVDGHRGAADTSGGAGDRDDSRALYLVGDRLVAPAKQPRDRIEKL